MPTSQATAGLTVLRPGLHTLVVDMGRPRCRSLGVPVGGAADRFSLAVGNALVGNQPEAAALEVSLAGPTLRASGEVACVVYGAPFDLASDRQELTAGTTFTLRDGEELRVVGTASEGARAYLCVSGGLQTPVVLGSRSALEPLRAGDELPCLRGTIRGRFVRVERDWEAAREPGGPVVLRALDGAQAEWFDGAAFFGPTTFAVTPASNRMGLRLAGPALVPGRELLSEPVCPGTVQVTRDGGCIVLGVDGQTIGGYPKIAQVIAADLDALGQLRPGDRVRSLRVTLDEAERHYRRRGEVLREWLARLRTAGPPLPYT